MAKRRKRGFGSTRNVHRERTTGFTEHIEWNLREANKAAARGKCSMAIDHAVEAIAGVGAFAAHTVASGLPMNNERHDLQTARVWRGQAREVIARCGGK